MRILLHQPVEGRAAGETVDIPEGRGSWLVVNGYASVVRDEDDDFSGAAATSVDADQDPTLAANREAADEEVPTTSDPTISPADDLGSVQDSSAAKAPRTAGARTPLVEFDPSQHTAAQVREFIDANPAQAGRVLELERAGKARKGVLESGKGSEELAATLALGDAQEGGNRELPIAVSPDTLAAAAPTTVVDEETGAAHLEQVEPDED